MTSGYPLLLASGLLLDYLLLARSSSPRIPTVLLPGWMPTPDAGSAQMILPLRRVFSRARCWNTPIRPRRCGLESGAALGYPPLLRFPAKNVVCSYPAQDQRITRDLVSDPIGDRNAGFPDVFYTLHFLIAQGGMARVFDQPAQSFFSPFLNVLRELAKVSFERVMRRIFRGSPPSPEAVEHSFVPGKSKGITTSGP